MEQGLISFKLAAFTDDLASIEQTAGRNDDLAGFLVLGLKCLIAGAQNVLAPLEGLCSFFVSCFDQPTLLILPNLADHLVIEVLDDVEMVKDRLEPLTLFFKGLLKIRIHVTRHSFHVLHPFRADMLDEIVDDLLALSVSDPEDMPSLTVDDMCCKPMIVMQFEFVDHQDLCVLLWLLQPQGVAFLSLAALRIFPAEPIFVNILHRKLSQASQGRHCFVRVAVSKKLLCVVLQFLGDHVMLCAEGHRFHTSLVALGAEILLSGETNIAQCRTDRKMPKGHGAGVVHMHPPQATRANHCLRLAEVPVEHIHGLSMRICFDPCSAAEEIRQSMRNHEAIRHISC